MSTVINPEITERSPWWIQRQRYYELVHFCLQYPDWKASLKLLDGLQTPAGLSELPRTNTNELKDPVGDEGALRAMLSRKIDMVELAAEMAGTYFSGYILKGVTEGIPYAVIRMQDPIPCNRRDYYEAYRKFFWILDQLRD